MLRVQRAANRVFVDGDWTPLSSSPAPGVYVSTWRLDGLTLFTAINRGETDAEWQVHGFDLGSGRADVAAIVIPARGIAAALQVEGDEPHWLRSLLAEAAADTLSTDATFPARTAQRVAAPRAVVGSAPADSVEIAAGEYRLPFAFRRRETGGYQGAPYVEEWKPLPPRLHDDRLESVDVTVGAVAVATTEVTAAQFAEFAGGAGGPDLTGGDGPATGITLAEARAYARSVGARLPTEFEWQLAATSEGFERSTPAVWNWTESEHSDGVTRFVMLKGGSDHESTGSDWYTDGGVRPPEFSLKYLLAGLGVEASSSIGFRLAWDLA
jgi:hypothetical protein